jgi:hypothetical protein
LLPDEATPENLEITKEVSNAALNWLDSEKLSKVSDILNNYKNAEIEAVPYAPSSPEYRPSLTNI